MQIIINQFFGIGDVIFCQNIAKRFMDMGHSITWPVLPHFLEGLQRAYPKITFVDMNSLRMDYERQDEHDWNGYRVVPLRFSDSLTGGTYDQCMASKYQLFGWNYSDWKDGAMWYIDNDRCEDLYFSLGLEIGEQYNLINCVYQSDFKGNKPIHVNNGFVNVNMREIEGFSLFDWAFVLMNAENIHTVSTSLFYLLELLPLSGRVHLYPRPNDPKFKHIDYLFTKNYILH